MTLNALEVVARAVARPVIRAAMPASPLSTDEWIEMMSLDHVPYLSTTLKVDQENIDGSFLSLVQGAYRSNGVVFACLATRFLLFSEARFAFQQMRGSRPGNLFGTPALSVLETPEPGRTTGDMLARMILDNDLAGIWFGLLRAGTIKRLRPDWTATVFGSKRKDATPQDPDSVLAGFSYMPGGPTGQASLMSFLPEEVAHYSTVPDGIRNYVGMPWLTPVLRELMADSAGTIHKLAYYRNAATPNLTVTMPAGMAKEKAEEWIELFEQEHRGAFNAFKTIYFGGGASADAIGANLGELDFRKIQAGGESRIIAAAGLNGALFGLGDIQGSALNAGNMAAIVRWIADSTMRPAWRNAAGSLQWVIGTPASSSRLWYDDRDVPFLRDDVRDSARATQLHGSTVGGLINNGFLPDDAVDAVMANDLRRLIGKHTGLVSVQLQPPGRLELPADGAAEGTAAQSFTGTTSRLREMLAAGWRPATALDEAIVASALSSSSSDLRSAIDGVRTAIAGPALVRSRGAFWPTSGPFVALGDVPKGVELPGDHQLVAEFPSMFEPIATARIGPGGVRCPNPACGKRVAQKLGPGSRLTCRHCKTEVVA
jgi:hypothetical protein